MHQVPYKRPLKTERDMNANAAEHEFLTIVSHELRTPTAAILGWAELLGRTALDDERLALGIEIIKRNAQLQAQLIEHLIDFSLIRTDDFKLDVQKIAILPTLKAAIETMMPLELCCSQRPPSRAEKALDISFDEIQRQYPHPSNAP